MPDGDVWERLDRMVAESKRRREEEYLAARSRDLGFTFTAKHLRLEQALGELEASGPTPRPTLRLIQGGDDG